MKSYIIYTLDPVNKTAKIVTSQSNCSKDVFLDRQGIVELIEKLKVRGSELKRSLGIKNLNQYKNRRYYRNNPVHACKDTGKIRVQRYSNVSKNKRAKQLFQELLDIGLQIQTYQNILSEMKYL